VFFRFQIAAKLNNEAGLLQLLSRDDVSINERNDAGNTPLHTFCLHARSDNTLALGTKLIDRGAPVNARNNSGETPLHHMVLNDARPGMLLFLLFLSLSCSLLFRRRCQPFACKLP